MAVTLPSSSNNRLKLNPPKQQQQIERRLYANTVSRRRMERHLANGSGRLKLGSGTFGLARSHIVPGVIPDATTANIRRDVKGQRVVFGSYEMMQTPFYE
jgi:hypothetical protein